VLSCLNQIACSAITFWLANDEVIGQQQIQKKPQEKKESAS